MIQGGNLGQAEYYKLKQSQLAQLCTLIISCLVNLCFPSFHCVECKDVRVYVWGGNENREYRGVFSVRGRRKGIYSLHKHNIQFTFLLFLFLLFFFAFFGAASPGLRKNGRKKGKRKIEAGRMHCMLFTQLLCSSEVITFTNHNTDRH